MPVSSRPLLGMQVLVTRPAGQARKLAQAIERLGGVAVLMPLVEIREPSDWAPVDRALAELDRYQWLVFTSVNGVDALASRMRQRGQALQELGRLRLAAIGPGTAEALRRHGLDAELVPAEYRSEGLAAALRARVAGQRVLLARADRGRDLLRRQLEAVAAVEQITVYAQADVAEPEAGALDRLQQGDIDHVTVTSSSIARALARVLGDAGRAQVTCGRVRLVSISPVTSGVLREEGLPVAAEAKVYTMDGVLEALIELARP